MNEMIAKWLFSGLSMGRANTGDYWRALQCFSIDMVRNLACQTDLLLNEHTPATRLLLGRHAKFFDGITALLPDIVHNQAQYSQHGNQVYGVGFPMARLFGVKPLASGEALDVAMGL